jgi:hypothetical protein
MDLILDRVVADVRTGVFRKSVKKGGIHMRCASTDIGQIQASPTNHEGQKHDCVSTVHMKLVVNIFARYQEAYPRRSAT